MRRDDDLTRAPIYIPRRYKRSFGDFMWAMIFLIGFAIFLGLVAITQVYFCEKDSWQECLIERY